VSYTYDNAGNLLTRTDQRGIVTTYSSYDALNRPGTISYSDGTPTVTLGHDGVWSAFGQLTSIANANSSTSLTAFDTWGRVTASTQQTGGQTYNFTYGYNLANALTSETLPSGRTLTSGYDTTGRLTTVSGALSGTTTNYLNVTQYWAHGPVKQMQYGNNVWRDYGYINSRLQLTGYWDTINEDPSKFLRQEFPNWVNGSGQNNGTLQSIQTLNFAGPVPYTNLGTITQTFGYDSLNRLTSASESGDWSQSYSYDQYGNMWMPSNTLTPPALGPVAPTSNVYNPANNQNVYSTYDANGNLTAFGAIGVSYDAENRQTAAGTNSYSYDGAGQRVSKTTGSGQITFVYDAFGQLAAEYAGGTVWTKDYVRAGGQIAAIENAYGAPCTTCYLSYDYLGSPRMVTDQSANIIARHDYAPFGQEIPSGVGVRTSVWGPSDNVNQKFTAQERDAETNLDFFQARYLSSGLGRFMSPDPGNAGADATNPQSWNGYAYVLNNPLTMTDPSGMDPGDGDGCDDGDDWCDGYPWPAGTGGPPSPPPPPPTQTESGGGNTLPPGSFPNGETLGMPRGIGVPSTLQVLLGIDSDCDFGPCSFADGQAGAAATQQVPPWLFRIHLLSFEDLGHPSLATSQWGRQPVRSSGSWFGYASCLVGAMPAVLGTSAVGVGWTAASGRSMTNPIPPPKGFPSKAPPQTFEPGMKWGFGGQLVGAAIFLGTYEVELNAAARSCSQTSNYKPWIFE
jgi:RHS repeat-associated protein